MTITLISQETYDQLLAIYNNYPKLTLQNEGFEYINPDTLTEEEKNKLKEVNDILKKAIKGFVRFFNFRLNEKTRELQIRFDFNWAADWAADDPGAAQSFVGVGYLYLDELVKGFRKQEA